MNTTIGIIQKLIQIRFMEYLKLSKEGVLTLCNKFLSWSQYKIC